MGSTNKKYIILALFLSLLMAAGVMVACSPAGRGVSRKMPLRERKAHTPIFDNTGRSASDTMPVAPAVTPRPAASSPIDSILGIEIPQLPPMPEELLAVLPDSLRRISPPDSLSETLAAIVPDSLRQIIPDSLRNLLPDSLLAFGHSGRDSSGRTEIGRRFDSLAGATDTVTRKKRDKPFLEAPVLGKNRDSLVYDVRNRLIFVYGEGDLNYEDNNLKADHMILNTVTKEIFGVGLLDTTTGLPTRPEFIQGNANYTMDTLTYNLESKKALVQGVATRDGEGLLLGRRMKKKPDNTIDIASAKYTTCDRIDHPHFYIQMTKAKVIPGKKIITGPAYFVMEDVPIYFLGIPGGFFPISTGPTAGFIMPTYGEESARGFYLREGGYYFRFGDYADLALTADIYTLGSWAVKAKTNYILRYKFSGNLGLDYTRQVMGEKNSSSYRNSGQFSLNWSHRQDPKFHPSSQFSASVKFATAGYTKQATTTLNDHLNTQTNSSISYSKSWTVGATPINLTASFTHSSNAQDSTISFTLPNISFSVGSFAPFKRKNAVGKQRWYEKITLSYSMQAQNSTDPRTKEHELFTAKTLREMTNGVRHSIPIKTSFNFFGVVSFSPSFNYNEVWNFKRQRRVWNPEMSRVELLDPEFGFFRMYGWNASGSFSTKLYGMFQVKETNKKGKKRWFQALRHVVTPTVGVSYAPDFTHPRYGFIDYYQSDSTGRVQTNSNYYMGNPRMTPAGAQAAINFSLSNQIEMKVNSKRDSTGMKKIPIIEQFSLSGSYDFLRDSNNLSNISLTLRTGQIFKNFAIQLNAQWDPYEVVDVNGRPVRTRKFNVGGGKFGRIVSTGWSFGYTFNSSNSSQPAMNDINSGAFVAAYANPWDPGMNLDPATRRQYMVSSYYDFTIPWNFGFNYSVSYNNNGLKSTITQTFGFNGSVNLTDKWGVTFNGGFDIAQMRMTPMSVNLTRDLHCWSMTFQWVPIGQLKSYMFHIGIKSGMLADIKYDKQSSRFDNLME